MQAAPSQFFPSLVQFIDGAMQRPIPEERRERLALVADYVVAQLSERQRVELVFICTHNSRRSHYGQIWAQVAAWAFGLEGVTTFSGGTEVTAMNPRAKASLERSGFQIQVGPGGSESNPHYLVQAGEALPPLTCFSKVFDDATNPSTEFGAVMTCNDADQNCPVIIGAKRLSLPYVDPKVADDSEQEAATYDERSQQIASEMLFLMAQVKARKGDA